MRIKTSRWIGFVVSLLIGAKTEAFPDLIRHGYVNCTACHISPTGGGVMTDYGRALSRELLSAKGGEREAEFLHGVLPPETLASWLRVGGDIRVLQLHREDPDRIVGRTIPMQANVDIAAVSDRLTAVISIGKPDAVRRTIRPVSPMYYVLWNIRDEFALRMGKLTPAFGLHMADHTLPTRQGLSLGAGQEREAFEGVWSGESWNIAGSLSRSARDLAKPQREDLVTLQVHRVLGDTHRVGFSLLDGVKLDETRTAQSLHGTFGITEAWAYLSEFTWQTRRQKQTSTTSLHHFSQLLWEFRRGWNLYFLETYQLGRLGDRSTLTDSQGLGLRYFPRPHFEIDATALRRRQAIIADRYDTEGRLLLHYYF